MPPPSKKDAIGDPIDAGDGKKVYTVGGQRFEIDNRYHLQKVLGYGAYGTVCSARDDEAPPVDGKPAQCAIKKISRVFDDLVDGKRILRELMVLSLLKHPNLMELYRIMKPLSRSRFEDIYMVSQLMDTDLHHIIRSRQKLTDEHNQYFIVQAFRGLAYMHSANVMHRDLKPSNLLVNGNCDLVICDFGLARGVDEGELTDYVVTRWYRPPELLTLNTRYTPALDIWSIALILGELLNRRVVLQGRDYISQLALVLDLLGTPTEEDLNTLSEEARKFILAQPRKQKRDFATVFPTATSDCIDLLTKCLVFNPKERMSAKGALDHPYLKSHKDGPVDEAPNKFEWALDNEELSAEQLRDGLWKEIVKYNPEAANQEDKAPEKQDSK